MWATARERAVEASIMRPQNASLALNQQEMVHMLSSNLVANAFASR